MEKNEQKTEKIYQFPKAKRGIDPNLLNIFSKPIDSKATAMQYALDSTATYKNGKKFLHTDKAKEIFDFICENVELPDVPLNAIFDELNKTMEDFRKKLDEKKQEE